MRIATWNINSVRRRVDHVVRFLEEADIDVLLLQETKCKEADFPVANFDGGLFGFSYEVASSGFNQWNGVAILSRVGLDEVSTNFPHTPQFANVTEARAIFATCGSLRLGSLYVPNGRALDHPHYQYKLNWLEKLQENLPALKSSSDPALPLLLGGDFNVIPYDDDVYDPLAYNGLYSSAPERRAWQNFTQAGLVELSAGLRGEYTFWDYRAGAWPRNLGMRIDHFWGSPAIADKITQLEVAKSERGKESTSDHAPVIIELALQ